MRLFTALCTTGLLLASLVSPDVRAQSSIDEIGPLPIALPEGRPILSLVPPSGTEKDVQEPCPCRRRRLSAQEVSARRIRFFREQAAKLRLDSKHKVHMHFFHRADLRGKIVSDTEDSITIRTRNGRKDVTVSYTDVSWIEREPTGREKFGRGARATILLTVTSPIWVPWFVLMLALYPRE